MNRTLTALLRQGTVILDGAWGTQLQARGLEPGQCPEDWNLIHEDRVRDVAQAYVHAGSQVILTNTFGASRPVLQRHGLDQFVKEINRVGAQISREAAGTDALVFASVGPTGKILMNGDMTVYEMECVFQEQVEALAEGGVDGFVIETMTDIEEAQIALKAAQSIGKPVVVSMVYDSGRDRDRTMMGVKPEQATESLDEWGADIIGANCGNGIDGFVSLCERIKSKTQKPIWLKANAGLPVIREGMTCYETTPELFAQAAVKLVARGASFIGGCCGTGPDHIRALAGQLASQRVSL